MAAKKTSKKSGKPASKKPAAKSSGKKSASKKATARRASKSSAVSRKTGSGATVRSTPRGASKSSKGVIASATETVRNLVSDVAAGAIRGATEVASKASDLLSETYQQSKPSRGRNKKR